MRLAAVADLHCTPESRGHFQALLAQAREKADVLLLGGDLTDYGLVEEAEILVQEFRQAAPLTMLGVLGNHDYESGRAQEVKRILTEGGIKILDGEAVEIQGVGFAGVKGFGGGFDDRMLQPWGEISNKEFVQEAVQEGIKLESALAKLRTPHKVVLMHYAPLKSTVEGEPVEIFPFLGSSRLEEPIDRHKASVVFHGHAHHGSPEGRTKANIPVYNVALPLLMRTFPQGSPFRVVELA